MKPINTVSAILAILACGGLALANPTISVNDNGGGLSTVPVDDSSGSVVYSSSDAYWSLVIATGLASPPYERYGTLTAPYMDLSIQATSTSAANANLHPLTLTFSSDEIYGPTSGGFQAQLSGHIVTGVGQPVTFNTYYNNTTLLTTSGSVAGPNYGGSWTSPDVSLGIYSMTEVITIQASSAAGASYSLDGTLHPAPLPLLAISRSGANVVVTWPTNATGFTLQFTTSLSAPATWRTNAQPAVVVNANWTVTNAISGMQTFYRLIQ